MPGDVCFFPARSSEAHAPSRELFGGKGSHLFHMGQWGLPVPPGVILSTKLCERALCQEDSLRQTCKDSLSSLGFFPAKPLLVSVRSGAPVSMPGMMETVLNLGITRDLAKLWTENSGSRDPFFYKVYVKFLQSFGRVVLGIAPIDPGEVPREASVEAWKSYGETWESLCLAKDPDFLTYTPEDFVFQSAKAVIQSWQGEKAKDYRKHHKIPHHLGTAVILQAMVFGNRDARSMTGVFFTRDPDSGKDQFFGEYLSQAQGEELVSGYKTPKPIYDPSHSQSLHNLHPEIYGEIQRYGLLLEEKFQAPQEIEFTVESGKLWILQTREGKLSPKAHLRYALDQIRSQKKTLTQSIGGLSLQTLYQSICPGLEAVSMPPLARGLGASQGGATGRLALTPSQAQEFSKAKQPFLFLRPYTATDDMPWIHQAQGMISLEGGLTSHCAVVARAMGKPAIVAVEGLAYGESSVSVSGGGSLKPGEIISMDGATGEIYQGSVPLAASQGSQDVYELLSQIKPYQRLRVWGNGDTPEEIQSLGRYGINHIGLCRTEHMFFTPDHHLILPKLFLSLNIDGFKKFRDKALDDFLKSQYEECRALFKCPGLSHLTLRLLDPPIHEFLPKEEASLEALAQFFDAPLGQIKHAIGRLEEKNPMLGVRGARLGLSYPDIYRAQLKAFFHANKEYPLVSLGIMVPFCLFPKELTFLKEIAHQESHGAPPWTFGAMVELPKAALESDALAGHVDFLSFGTNDLTQTTLGLSRDDTTKLIQGVYSRPDLFSSNPFWDLDSSVQKLLKISCNQAKRANPHIKLSICGEHGGNPDLFRFFEALGIEAVSCSQNYAPGASLASAQMLLGKANSRA